MDTAIDPARTRYWRASLVVLLAVWAGLELAGSRDWRWFEPAPPAATAAPPSAAELELLLEHAFGNSGSGALHKWVGDVRVELLGAPTAADRRVLEGLLADLAELLPEPRFSIVGEGGNLQLHFVPTADFAKIEPNYVPGNRSFFWCWWDAAGRIERARLLLPAGGEVSQQRRANLIASTFVRSLGLLHTSRKHPASVLYAGSSAQVDSLAPIDRALLALLYRPELLPGFDRERVSRALGVAAETDGARRAGRGEG